MKHKLKLLDVVALNEQVTEKNLKPGQVGTIVEILDDNHFEVEFSDDSGKPYLTTSIPGDKLLLLHFTPEAGRKNDFYQP